MTDVAYAVGIITLLGFMLLAVITMEAYIQSTESANKIVTEIDQCETELPRHQHCEYKITAYIKENEE